MFEKPLYEFEPTAARAVESDLFRDYELKSWVFTPRVVRFVALSTVVNIVALLVVAQTSLLTLKGCDSPLVGSVCKVLDTVYVGALLWGTEREYADAAYAETRIDEDDEITYIDVSNVIPPIKYPEGYFQVANPEQFIVPQEIVDGMAFTQDIPGIPNGIPMAQGNSLFDTPQKLPTPNPDILDDLSDGNSYNNGSGGFVPFEKTYPTKRPKGPKKVKVSPTPDYSETPDEDVVAQLESPSTTPTPVQTFEPTPTPSETESKEDRLGVFINKRPLTDGAKATIQAVDAKQIKLETNFKVGLTGTLGLAKDGKTVILKNPKPIPLAKGEVNDPAMEKFVRQWILWLGDSGWLGHIDNLDKQKKIKDKRVAIMLGQNDTEFVAIVNAELPDENTAKTFASSLNFYIDGAAAVTDGDEKLFLDAAETTFSGSSLVLNVKFDKKSFQEILGRYIAKEKAAPKPTDSTAGSKPADNPVKN